MADEDEIYLTREVFEAPGVAGALGRFAVQAEQSQLKGIAEAVDVYRVFVKTGPR